MVKYWSSGACRESSIGRQGREGGSNIGHQGRVGDQILVVRGV